MSEPMQVYLLPPSPNNVKVVIALNYKKIPYEAIPLGLEDDRSRLVEATGQPLTPAIVDRGRALFDSAAILRYLDANFRETPPLFSRDADELRDIERWERYGRRELLEPFGEVLDQMFSEDPDPDAARAASEKLQKRTVCIEEHLAGGKEWLVGDRMTAADVTCAVAASYGMVPDAMVEKFPPARFIQEHYHLGEGRERTRAWIQRVTAHHRW